MTRFIIRRCFMMVLMMAGLLAITFIISRIAPGDPARLAAGPDATAEMVERMRVAYGLDKPLVEQFAIYAGNLLQGDFGQSIYTTRAVLTDLIAFFPATLELVCASIIFAIIIGIPLGMLSAVIQNSFGDHTIRVLSVLGVAMPMFWLGLMLQLFFGLELGWFPIGGRIDLLTDPPTMITGLYFVDGLLAGRLDFVSEALHYMVLPALALSFPALASIIRVNRAEMLETLNQDYIVNARAQGLSQWRIVGIYALRNAMLPTMAMIGLRFGWMLGGTVLVETVFDWPGVGLYAVDAVKNSDFEPIMGVTIVLGFFFMLTNFLIDLAYAWLDPRVRHQV